MNKKGIIILLMIIIGISSYKFVFQTKGHKGELVPAENATIALNEVLKNGKPTFLEFTSDNCPACRRAKPWIEEMFQAYKGEVNFILADVDKGGLALGQEMGVTAVPTFIYFDKSGEILDAFAGYPPTSSQEYLEDKIKALLD